MRKREGIEPRYGRETVGADAVSNVEGNIYLGFTHYWGRSRTGKIRLKRKTSKKRLRRALVEINHWLRQERSKRKPL